jgi:hypothetical protein
MYDVSGKLAASIFRVDESRKGNGLGRIEEADGAEWGLGPYSRNKTKYM